MMCDPLVRGPSRRHRRDASGLAAVMLLGLGLAGCGATGEGAEAPPVTLTPLAATVPADPIAAFAATASPGDIGTVISDGLATPVRLQRSYRAASGRECREVLLGGSIEERSRLICRDAGGWAATRPLLRGGVLR